jgi:hypothetical protein
MTSAGSPDAVNPAPVAVEHPLFPVGTTKFIVLSICTLGLYEAFWCYQSWKRIRRETGEELSPFWRAVFAPLWGFSLFPHITRVAAKRHIPVMWSDTTIAVWYLLLSASWRLPDPWWLISVATFVPFLPVLKTVREVNAKAPAAEGDNASFSGANIAWVVIGGVLVVMAVIGSFLPVEPDI